MEDAKNEPLNSSQKHDAKSGDKEPLVVEQKKSTSLNFKVFFFGIVIALIITFTLQNNAEVEINFLFWTFTSVRAVIVFLAFGLGWLSAFIYGLTHKKKRKK